MHIARYSWFDSFDYSCPVNFCYLINAVESIESWENIVYQTKLLRLSFTDSKSIEFFKQEFLTLACFDFSGRWIVEALWKRRTCLFKGEARPEQRPTAMVQWFVISYPTEKCNTDDCWPWSKTTGQCHRADSNWGTLFIWHYVEMHV